MFGQTEITIISQELQNRRAIFIAGHHGIDAIGFDAADVGASYGWWDHRREQLADAKAVLDIFILRARPLSSAQSLRFAPIVDDRAQSASVRSIDCASQFSSIINGRVPLMPR